MPEQGQSHRAYVRRMRLRRRELLKAVAAGGTLGFLTFLTGCGPNEIAGAVGITSPAATPTTSPAGQPTPTTASSPSPVVSPTAATSPGAQPATPTASASAGTLRLNIYAEPGTLDPARASFVHEFEIVRRVFCNCYRFDESGSLVADQAAALPEVSNDGTQVTVRLREGLTWSDGKPLTAKDFVYGILRQLNPNVQSSYAYLLYSIKGAMAYNMADPTQLNAEELQKLRDAVGVAAPDDRTIVYTLEQASAWFPNVLATSSGLPVREDLVTAGGKPEDNVDWVKLGTYIGNGPYVMTKHDPDVEVVLEANPRYSAGAPPIGTVQIRMIRDTSSAFNAYRTGELDVALVTALTKDAVDRDPVLNSQLLVVPSSCTYFIALNLSMKPFDDVQVRRAFAAAFDRTTFATQVLKGLAIPAEQFLPPGFPGHFKDIGVQRFDPAAARELLAQAGYPNGQGLPEIKMTYPENDLTRLMSGATQEFYKQHLGVDVKLDSIDPNTFSGIVQDPATRPQMFILGWCHDYPDPQNWYSTVFNSSSPMSLGWKHDDFDRLTNEADAELDPNVREQLYKQAATILMMESPVVFIHHSVFANLIKPEIRGYRASMFDYFFGQSSLQELRLAR